MKLLSSYLPPKYRSAVRFVIVGTTGMFVQDGIYRGALAIFRAEWPDVAILMDVAFAIGFVLEMIVNYFCTAWYTYSSKPNWKNAGGFLLARAINLVFQFTFLHLLIWMSVPENWAGFPSIFMAGIINYFICLFFFRKPKEEKLQTMSHQQD